MSFQFRKGSLEREVHRVARKELEGALQMVLSVAEQPRSMVVHEARQHVKKVRALIRLLKSGLDDSFYSRENAALRKTSQRMSPIRDSHVRVQTVEKLIAKTPARCPPTALAHLRDAMAARMSQALDEAEKRKWSKKAAADLERALCRIPKWPLKSLTPQSLRSGLKAACKNARDAHSECRRESTDEHFHELRKSVKDLWSHLCLLGGDRPPVIRRLTKKLRELGQRLGDDHDLALLLAARNENPLPDAADWEKVTAAITYRRLRLQRAALRLAADALARKPGAFADFVLERWIAWRD